MVTVAARHIGSVRTDVSLLTADDLYLFNEGTHYRLYGRLGAHVVREPGCEGTYFAVWAPNAATVSVVGDFNGWDRARHPLQGVGNAGIWHGFIPGVTEGAVYKYHIASRHSGFNADKADPFANRCELPPRTASIVADLRYSWSDQEWLKKRREKQAMGAPISIYEVHLGSWMRVPEENNRFLTYRELAPKLVSYVKEMNFTHVEFLPVMEHPFYGSWGYQVTGFFSPTSRYGTPQDLMFLIDALHQAEIGVILDWVPSHFPTDGHGLSYFDGTHLFEHADPKQGFHPDWNSSIFNYGRHEVVAFLTSSALFWLDVYHADGLRVDGVASMLYLDYSRKAGEWIPNKYGGKENIDAIQFLRRLNEVIYTNYPEVQTFAEESTAWPMVSKPTYVGGLGFGYKWDMGWMHDTLQYISRNSIHRKYHHNDLTFRLLYAFTENFVLPLSHDEVVHGKGSLWGRMPGDDWQKNANLRALLGYMHGQPGKKLLFMGGEFGQQREWNHDSSLDWHLLHEFAHEGNRRWLADLNRTYRSERALHEMDCSGHGFEWVDANDSDQSIYTYLRKDASQTEWVLVVINMTPLPRWHYRVGVHNSGFWKELLNSDAPLYGGSGLGNYGGVWAQPIPTHGRPYSLDLIVPPLSAVFFKC